MMLKEKLTDNYFFANISNFYQLIFLKYPRKIFTTNVSQGETKSLKHTPRAKISQSQTGTVLIGFHNGTKLSNLGAFLKILYLV